MDWCLEISLSILTGASRFLRVKTLMRGNESPPLSPSLQRSRSRLFRPDVQMLSPNTSTARQFKSLWELGGMTLLQLGQNVFSAIIKNDIFGQAAELAFYFLFALFPLVLIMMTLFGLFASQRIELQNHLLSYSADLLPPAAFQLLRNLIRELATHASGGKLTLGIVSAFWGVSGGVNAMIKSLNRAIGFAGR